MGAYAKNTGFSKKPHPYQIFSYLFFLSKVLMYTAVVLPLNELIPAVKNHCLSPLTTFFPSFSHNKVILSVFYYLSAFCMAYFGYKCTASDPTDEVIIRTREAEAKG